MGLVWGSGARWGGVWRGAEEVGWIQALFAELRRLEMQPHLPSQAPAPSTHAEVPYGHSQEYEPLGG